MKSYCDLSHQLDDDHSMYELFLVSPVLCSVHTQKLLRITWRNKIKGWHNETMYNCKCKEKLHNSQVQSITEASKGPWKVESLHQLPWMTVLLYLKESLVHKCVWSWGRMLVCSLQKSLIIHSLIWIILGYIIKLGKFQAHQMWRIVEFGKSWKIPKGLNLKNYLSKIAFQWVLTMFNPTHEHLERISTFSLFLENITLCLMSPVATVGKSIHTTSHKHYLSCMQVASITSIL